MRVYSVELWPCCLCESETWKHESIRLVSDGASDGEKLAVCAQVNESEILPVILTSRVASS